MTYNLSNFCESELGEINSEKILLDIDVVADNLDVWLSENAKHVSRLLKSSGALLIRSLPIRGSKKLEKVLTTIYEEKLLEYNYRSTPRTKMRGRIYTSSEYHPDQTIGLHNENAYSNQWAMNIAFYCVKQAEVGGETPIANSVKVYNAIPDNIREKFERKKLLYVRNYGDIDLPWSEVFQTQDRSEVEKYCDSSGIEFKWIGTNGLRTRQLANAAYFHPTTREKVWFNQAHLFHISSLTESDRESILNNFKKEDLPRNVYYGDGEDIEYEALDHIRNAYQKHMVTFDWCEGDLLLLDNMLYSHGRKPFSGSRRVLVGMASAMDSSNETLQESNNE